MKTFFTILIIAFNSVFANAQQQSDKSDIAALLEQAKTDFKNITGNKKSEENGVAIYACNHKSTLGELGDILKDSKTGETYYSMFINYNSATEEFKKALLDYVDLKFPSPEYYVIGDEDDDYEELLVYSDLTDPTKEKKQYLAYYIDTDPKTKKKTFELIIYGASTQKVTFKK